MRPAERRQLSECRPITRHRSGNNSMQGRRRCPPQRIGMGSYKPRSTKEGTGTCLVEATSHHHGTWPVSERCAMQVTRSPAECQRWILGVRGRFGRSGLGLKWAHKVGNVELTTATQLEANPEANPCEGGSKVLGGVCTRAPQGVAHSPTERQRSISGGRGTRQLQHCVCSHPSGRSDSGGVLSSRGRRCAWSPAVVRIGSGPWESAPSRDSEPERRGARPRALRSRAKPIAGPPGGPKRWGRKDALGTLDIGSLARIGTGTVRRNPSPERRGRSETPSPPSQCADPPPTDTCDVGGPVEADDAKEKSYPKASKKATPGETGETKHWQLLDKARQIRHE